jgi:type II secretory pathway pseudopilin PulG
MKLNERKHGRVGGAFTLIELILVMAILTAVFALTAPTLSRFFHGRTLDSEARRLLALTRQGQSRAVSEGVPMEVWIDSSRSAYGLEAEPSYEKTDPKAVEFTMETELQIDISTLKGLSGTGGGMNNAAQGASASKLSNHPNLPRIRFLPDGTVTEESPQELRITGRDGNSLWLRLSRNRMTYEISNQART